MRQDLLCVFTNILLFSNQVVKSCGCKTTLKTDFHLLYYRCAYASRRFVSRYVKVVATSRRHVVEIATSDLQSQTRFIEIIVLLHHVVRVR
jgi:predicted RNA-binding protein with PIN domain